MATLTVNTEIPSWLALAQAAGLKPLTIRGKSLLPIVQGGMGVGVSASGLAAAVARLGGMGTMVGPSVGAAIIITMENYLASLGSWVTIIMGFTFVTCVLVFRRGIVGEIEHRFGGKKG